MTPLEQWPITVMYLALLAAFALPAKLASALRSRSPRRERLMFLLLTPTLSLRTWQARTPTTRRAVLELLAGALPSLLALALFYGGLRRELHDPIWLAGYAAVIPIYLLVEVIGNGTRIACLPFGVLPPIHRSPWAAVGLGDFWGRRWNRLVADWLADVIFAPLRRRPRLAVFAAFAASGLLHEWLANLPLYLLTQRSLFGSMMLYFWLQAAGVLFERRWFAHRPKTRRAFAWLVIVGPAPLVLNEAALRIFGFVL